LNVVNASLGHSGAMGRLFLSIGQNAICLTHSPVTHLRGMAGSRQPEDTGQLVYFSLHTTADDAWVPWHLQGLTTPQPGSAEIMFMFALPASERIMLVMSQSNFEFGAGFFSSALRIDVVNRSTVITLKAGDYRIV
jgi:hypothetical protein